MSNFALVPAYNEEKNIGEVISRLKKFKQLNIVVVDDGSTDRTYEIAKRYRVKIIRHEKNLGKAHAVKSGLKEILKKDSNPNIVLIDSDLQFDPEEATKLLKPLSTGAADFVSGYRNFNVMPFRHRLGNVVWRGFFNFFFGTNLKDTNCGYMALNGEAAAIMANSVYGGYILENSMYIKALERRLRIQQVPVKVHYKKKSKVVRGVRMVAGILIFIVREGLKYRFSKK